MLHVGKRGIGTMTNGKRRQIKIWYDKDHI